MQTPKNGIAVRIDKKFLGISITLNHRQFQLSYFKK